MSEGTDIAGGSDPKLDPEKLERSLDALLGASGDELDLAEAALLFGALDRPRVGLGRYRDQLSDMTAAGSALEDCPDAEEAAKTLVELVAKGFGFRGDDLTYDDLQNANLIRVLDRHKGLPVALGILYIHIGRAHGWQTMGLNFPAHFLVSVEGKRSRALLDPFAGRVLEGANEVRAFLKAVAGKDAELSPDQLAPMNDRAVLLRLQNNIRARLAAQNKFPDAARVATRMLRLAPNNWQLAREAALLHARAGSYRAAQALLNAFVVRAVDAADREAAEKLASKLAQALH
ncbi:MAG TPA: transglutaminase-like domain-containing protein [Alphaproteobacteria bacterium]|jgi:regulator of sirC expression with transglutaminase-like and TPR domain|nr:transglutaminase-like domain-containing protein [Alphaproteobacteria bacterium]